MLTFWFTIESLSKRFLFEEKILFRRREKLYFPNVSMFVNVERHCSRVTFLTIDATEYSNQIVKYETFRIPKLLVWHQTWIDCVRQLARSSSRVAKKELCYFEQICCSLSYWTQNSRVERK